MTPLRLLPAALMLTFVSCLPEVQVPKGEAAASASAAATAKPAPSARIAVTAPAVAPDDTSLDATIRRSAGYLARHTSARGRYKYRLSLDPAAEPAGGYNELRHAGAMYALAVAEKRRPEEAQRAALARARNYLLERYVGPAPSGTANPPPADSVAVWSLGRREKAKLGGAGLALVGLLTAHAVAPDDRTLDICKKLARFVLWMQKPDGTFYSRYLPTKEGRSDSWTSLYYPGEAALGLVMLHEVDGDPRWRDAAARALMALAKKRAGKARVPPDHWALIATARLFEKASKGLDPIDMAALRGHATSIAQSMLAARDTAEVEDAQHGCLTGDGRTTPTATRLEGLIAIHPHLPEPVLKTQVEAAAADGIAFLQRAQARRGDLAGGIPGRVAGRGISADLEVRIDYVQHALSAFMSFEALKKRSHQ